MASNLFAMASTEHSVRTLLVGMASTLIAMAFPSSDRSKRQVELKATGVCGRKPLGAHIGQMQRHVGHGGGETTWCGRFQTTVNMLTRIYLYLREERVNER